jgi:uncharacterized radical SAM superfamily Fe-S cluster-containing enzyme
MKQKMADVSFEGIQKTNRQGLLLHKCFFYASGGETCFLNLNSPLLASAKQRSRQLEL